MTRQARLWISSQAAPFRSLTRCLATALEANDGHFPGKMNGQINIRTIILTHERGKLDKTFVAYTQLGYHIA